MSNWWNDFTGTVNNILGLPEKVASGAAGSWLSSSAGSLASGLDAAFVAFIHDLWDVILGPLEIILGAIIFMLGLTILVRNDMTGIGVLLR